MAGVASPPAGIAQWVAESRGGGLVLPDEFAVYVAELFDEKELQVSDIVTPGVTPSTREEVWRSAMAEVVSKLTTFMKKAAANALAKLPD